MKVSPLVKMVSMFVAVVTGILVLLSVILCCSYCNLQTKYASLEQSIQDERTQAGLPDDYEFDQDVAYQQELKR